MWPMPKREIYTTYKRTGVKDKKDESRDRRRSYSGN
jgi:hypothetical protein